MTDYAEELYRTSIRRNLPRFDMCPDNNILWITGLPGSGKSTLARCMAGADGVVIGLDFFVQLLESAGISEEEENYWRYVDAIRDQIVKIGYDLFDEGRVLVVEGIQIYRKWLTGDVKNFFAGQPLIVLRTERELSIRRLMFRNKQNCSDKDLVSWYRDKFETEERFLQEFLEEVGE